jgi:DNA invertase Pin-like site-specific DNA recombinase
VTRRLLPAKPDELRGLRARRYIRVSSEEQGLKYGPERQHQDTTEAIARLGLEEVGVPFVDEQSAWSRSGERPELRRLVTAATAGEFDVLVVAYFSRWSRDTEVALRVRRELHAAGVVVWFVDEAFLSSDEDNWDRFLDEAVGAEKFSHRLSRNIRKTLRTKFERHGDQAGSPGLGFIRTPQPEARLAIDPRSIHIAVGLFERYARGDVSYRELAGETGIAEGAIRAILANPLYNGWARRHRRQPDEARVAAPWRSSPPVSDELWAQVADVRARRLKHVRSDRSATPHLLAKLLVCECGRGIPADTLSVPGRARFRRYRHEDCGLWAQGSYKADVFEGPIAAQIAGIRLDASTLARIRAFAGKPAPADTDLRRHQLELELRKKATDHAGRRLTTEAYLAEHARITAEIDGPATLAPAMPIDDGDQVVEALRSLRDAWRDAGDEARATLAKRIYRRIVVRDREFVGAELTPEAKRMGLALALPERVSVMAVARPARLGRGTAITRSVVTIPIVGRREWLRASRSA